MRKIDPPSSTRINIPLLLLAAVIIIADIWLVFLSGNNFLDQKVFDTLSLHVTRTRTDAMRFISFFGSPFFLIPANLLIVTYLIVKKNNWLAIRLAYIQLSSVAMMSLLKIIFARHRPSDPLIEPLTNHSFPSGHSFNSVAFFGMLIWMVFHYAKNKRIKNISIACLTFFILSIGFSRIYLRVHYPTDVIAGLTMGYCWLILSLVFLDKYQSKVGQNKPL